MTRNELRGCRTRTVHEQRADPQIVDALEDEDVRHASLRENIPIEPCQRADAGAVHQDTIAVDAKVENTDTSTCRRQAPREMVWPPVVGVRRGVESVGDRIAQCDEGAGAIRCDDIDSPDKEPRSSRGRARQFLAAELIARGGEIARLSRAAMNRERRWRRTRVVWEIDVDRDVPER